MAVVLATALGCKIFGEMQYFHCPTRDAFIAEASVRGLRRAVLAWRREYGPASTPDGTAAYRLVREVTLLAYDQGTILRCELSEVERDEVGAALRAAGLEIEERCRNLAAPG
jgi:hypothetical protein